VKNSVNSDDQPLLDLNLASRPVTRSKAIQVHLDGEMSQDDKDDLQCSLVKQALEFHREDDEIDDEFYDETCCECDLEADEILNTFMAGIDKENANLTLPEELDFCDEDRPSRHPTDLVRFYMNEVGPLKVLTPEEERLAAQAVERACRRYQRVVFASPFTLRLFISLMEDFLKGEAAFDRTFDSSQSDRNQLRERTIRQIPIQLRTLDAILDLLEESDEKTRLICQQLRSTTDPAQIEALCKERRKIRRRATRASRHAARILEPMRFRIDRLRSAVAKVQLLSNKLTELVELTHSPDFVRYTEQRQSELLTDLRELRMLAGESPTCLKKRLAHIRQIENQYYQAFNFFIVHNLKLVVSIAKRYRTPGINIEELIQEGNMGMMRALEKFEWRLGYKFSTYASSWIEQAITRSIQDYINTIRIPTHVNANLSKIHAVQKEESARSGRSLTEQELAERSGIERKHVSRAMSANFAVVSLTQTCGDSDDTSIGDYVADKTMPCQEDLAQKSLIRAALRRALRTLPPRERQVLILRYGLENGMDYTLEEIGRVMGITRERVRQIEAKAIEKLRTAERFRFLAKFVGGTEYNAVAKQNA
jgi:RNA polymerase primary sigma factor